MKPKSIEKIDFYDFYDILDHIERCPGLFLLRQNLELLYSLINGLKFANNCDKISILNIDKLDFFNHLT